MEKAPAGFTSMPEALKVRYRPLFVAIKRVFAALPCGASEMFRVLDYPTNSSLTEFSPDGYDDAPTLLKFLQVLEYTKDRRIAQELCALAECIAERSPTRRNSPSSKQAAADALAAAMRPVLYNIDAVAMANTFQERNDARDQLLRIIDAANAMYHKLNG